MSLLCRIGLHHWRTARTALDGKVTIRRRCIRDCGAARTTVRWENDA